MNPSTSLRRFFCRLGGFPVLIVYLSSIFSATAVFAESSSLQRPEKLSWDFYLSSLNLSEPVPIKENFNDWQTEKFKPGKRIYTKQLARMGFSTANYSFGVSQHYYYYLNFSEDTALWQYMEKNDLLELYKEELELSLDANHTYGRGVYLSRSFSWKEPSWGEFSINTTLSYLDLKKITYGTLEGLYDPHLDLDNNTHFTLDYAYSEERLLDRDVEPPSGKGLTLDLAIRWQWQKHLLEANIEELYSSMRWRSAPASKITGDVGNLSQREEGVITLNEFYSKIDQHLPIHSKVNYDYQAYPNFYVGGEYEGVDSKDWFKLKLSWKNSYNYIFSISHNINDAGWGIGVKKQRFVLALESDSTNFDRAHLLKLIVGIHYSF